MQDIRNDQSSKDLDNATIYISKKEANEMLDTIRRKLLDLSLRNKLLNVPIVSKSSKQFLKFAGVDLNRTIHELEDGHDIWFACVPEPKLEESTRFGYQNEPPRADQWAEILGIPTWLEPDEKDKKKSGPKTELFSVLNQKISELSKGKADSLIKSIEKELESEDWELAKVNKVLAFYGYEDLNGYLQVFRDKGKPHIQVPKAAPLPDRQLRAIFYQKNLDAYLKNIFRTYRNAVEELGIGTLYLICGFLEWRETDGADKSFFAPLVTYPVEMSCIRSGKGGVLNEYTISAANEEPQQNLSLEEKLKTDYNINLPKRGSDSNGVSEDIESYFARVDKAISTKSNWKLHRYVALGNLEFSKLMMYRDLVPESWPGGIQSFFDSPLLSFLFKEKTSAPTNISGDDYYIDTIEGLETDIPLIDKADSSQHSALIDVLNKGKNLVIEGPPGTGKSQTITNLIAGALYKGKSVLFVSEKTAALEVVKRRLDAVGLGDFCLLIQQANNANKRQILDDLKKRIDLNPLDFKQFPFRSPVDSYRFNRDRLNSYADLINIPWGNTGKTIHEILTAQVRYQSCVPHSERSARNPLVSADSFTWSKQEDYKRNILLIQNSARALCEKIEEDSIAKCAWFGLYTGSTISQRQVDELIQSLSDWQENLIARRNLLRSLAELLNVSTEQYGSLESQIREIPAKNINADFKKALQLVKAHGTIAEEEIEHYFSYLRNIFQLNGKVALCLKPEHLSKIINGETTNPLTLSNIGLNEKENAHSLDSLSEALKTIREGVESVESLENILTHLKSSLPRSIASRITPTIQGYKFLRQLLQMAEYIRSDLIALRASAFDDIDADVELARIERQLAWLRQTEKELGSTFVIDKALELETEELAEIERSIKNSGFFAFLLSGYRSAKEKLLAISVNPNGNVKQICQSIDKLREFKIRNKEFETIYGYREKYGKVFCGRKTHFQDLQDLRNWCKRIREEWGYGFGPNVVVGNDLIALDRNLLGSLKAQAAALKSNTDKVLGSLSELGKLFPEAASVINKGWEAGNQALLSFCTDIKNRISKVESLVNNNNLTVKDIYTSISDANSLLYAIQEAKKFEETFGFTTNIQRAVREGDAFADIRKLRATLIFTQQLSEMKAKDLLDRFLALTNEKDVENLSDLISKLEESRNNTSVAQLAFVRLGQVDLSDWFREIRSGELDSVIERNNFALSRQDELQMWSQYMQYKKTAESLGFMTLWERLLRGEIRTEQFSDYVYNAVYNTLSDEITEKRADIFVSTGAKSEQTQTAFRDADETLTEFSRKIIINGLLKRVPPAGTHGYKVGSYTQMHLLNHEISKKKQHIPIRQLFRRAGEAVMELKPCWMMSPLAVAKFLEPGHLKFDLIVMDEASQIRPEDALGTLLRGNKIVVVGDPKQLPPTSFFQKTGFGALDTDYEEPEERPIVGEYESILDTMSNWLPKRMLRWHYRSRHESLIAFSNERFYDNKLIIFPSPMITSDDLGLRFTYIENGEFDKGFNRREAEKVVNAIIDHAKEHADESLAVVTMNASQQTLIEELLDTRLINYPNEKVLMDRLYNMTDPFIIKNLENIQGDERDVVFISCTYGKAPGTNVVRQKFGPINLIDGWRRLNVLFTRARKRMHVFSSMLATDIHPQESSTSFESLSALRGFIETASSHNCTRDPISYAAREPDSDFEIAVADKLRDFGFECHYQIGAAGYFIDIAVVDPNDPNRYLMAIECDGSTYHSAKSACDRDVLRQQILENLGWRVRRIWSTDWFTNASATLKPIIEELKQLANESAALHPSSQEEIREVPSGGEDKEIDPLEKELRMLKQEIELHYPDVPYAKQLLRPEIMKILVEESPTTIEEYQDAVPHYLIAESDQEVAKAYTPKIIETIRAFVEGQC